MKYAIASLLATTSAINIRAEAEANLGGSSYANMVCDGVDPGRYSQHTVNLGAANGAADCLSKCVSHGQGCSVVAYAASNGSCWGYDKYTGSCSPLNGWKTFGSSSDSCNANYERIFSQTDETLTGKFVWNNMVNQQFVDPSFPADRTMLWTDAQKAAGGGGNDGNASQIRAFEGLRDVTYVRPTEVDYHPKPWAKTVPKAASAMSLWGTNGVDVRISQQGYDGDCWFLSQASSLAMYPERIKSLFPGQDKYSENGVFRVRFFVRGEPVHVIVDDRVPAHNQTSAEGWTENYPLILNRPSKAGAWWLVILEKAFAKLNVNYLGINSGQTAHAMRYMTGQPTVQYNAASLSPIQLWNVVVDGLNNKYNMGAACQVSHFNMVSGHAYGVIGAVKLTGGAHDGQMMIKTRNPWGTNKYNGPWSENASQWTADYRAQAGGYGTQDIGEIWLPIETWSSDYAYITVNHWRSDWKVSSIEGSDLKFNTLWGNKNTWITIDNPVEQEVLLECYQNDARLFPAGCESENSPLNFQFLWLDDKVNSLRQIATQSTGGNSGGQCNGNAMVVKKLPAGKTQVRVIDFNASTAGHKTLFKLKAFATNQAISITQQEGNTYII